ncbi:DUF6702 family protein [Winogradskyella vidalii]|uniref:DUF6702 family protein n=1 Tax=Winogradskyella vidalii TaxID=2615024 RepID=UPI0015CE33C0|nr:DUF6702 family protein [Winogradskyella vidalii]
MKPLSLFLALLLFTVLNSNRNTHEYYVSVTEVGYAEKQNALQIISQIFIDDFETLMRKRYDDTITLDVDSEPQVVEDYMNRYLSDKLKIKVNGTAVNFNFIGKEYKEDIVYCYLEIENVSDITSIELSNQVLFDVFSDQQNIVRMKLLDRNKSFLLVPENDTCLLNFR